MIWLGISKQKANLKMLYSLFIILTLVVPSPAFAYFDPGSGSMFVQALIGTIAAAATVVGLYWHKFRMFFLKLFGRDGSSQSDRTDNNDL